MGSAAKLGLRDAARIIFDTREPDGTQVVAVRDLLVQGALAGERRNDRWYTSAEAVAEYLAASTLRKGEALAQDRSTGSVPPGRRRQMATSGPANPYNTQRGDAGSIRHVYRDYLKDYFLAVVNRRSTRNRSAAFRQAVLAGRVGGILLIVFLWLGIYRVTFPPPDPSHQAVEAWLVENLEHYEIVQWFPPEPHPAGGSQVRLRYKYFPRARKSVLTNRVFVIRDGQVVSVSNTASEDG